MLSIVSNNHTLRIWIVAILLTAFSSMGVTLPAHALSKEHQTEHIKNLEHQGTHHSNSSSCELVIFATLSFEKADDYTYSAPTLTPIDACYFDTLSFRIDKGLLQFYALRAPPVMA